MPNIALKQEVIAAAITITLIILYLHASNVHQHSTFNRSRAAMCSDTLISEAGFLQNFSAYKNWSPLSSNF